MLTPGILNIYGPPGTKATVDGLLAAMAPSPSSGPRLRVPPEQTVSVIEVKDGSHFDLGSIHITVASNSHYAATPGGDAHVSLSYRFDLPDRSITYTGDTGPSSNVEKLAAGTDLLVSEIIDPEDALADIKRVRPDIGAEQLAIVRRHFEQEHLTALQVGLLAQHASAKAVVLTHDAVDPRRAPRMKPGIEANFHGSISFAEDLNHF